MLEPEPVPEPVPEPEPEPEPVPEPVPDCGQVSLDEDLADQRGKLQQTCNARVDEASRLKLRGNARLAAGEPRAALEAYLAGADALQLLHESAAPLLSGRRGRTPATPLPCAPPCPVHRPHRPHRPHRLRRLRPVHPLYPLHPARLLEAVRLLRRDLHNNAAQAFPPSLPSTPTLHPYPKPLP